MNSVVRSGLLPGSQPLRLGWPGWLLSSLIAIALVIIYFSGLELMVSWWISREEYSHAWLIPPLAAFLVWQRSDVLRAETFRGSWWGVVLVIGGLLLWLAGEMSALYTVIQYGFLVSVTGAVLAFTGMKAFRSLWMALFILLFMVPLPNFIYFNLSQQLQLLSSEIGVWVIRSFGISVYLEGNVIDLGSYQLQVAEACSGLRYLFPLMTLGFVVALFFRAPLWQRALLFASTAPITVLMNSFRIGVIGVLVDQFGTAQAEGFLHEFEGWVIFMACFALLFAEMALLRRMSGDRRPFGSIFAIELPPRSIARVRRTPRVVPTPAKVAAGLLVAATIPAVMIPQRVEVVPQRAHFSGFPLQLGSWRGRHDRLDDVQVDSLKVSDYVMANYEGGAGDSVNLFVAYYDSQRKGESAHSPRACLPGGGWVIEQFDERGIGASIGGEPLRVNRALIAQGSSRLLVYYWFQQRGRPLTNEYLVKWFLFWDSLTRNRTDGSLVRLVAPIPPGMNAARAEATLQQFAAELAPALSPYVPE